MKKKYIKKLENCTKRSELNEMEGTSKRQVLNGTNSKCKKWSLRTIDVREEALINQELDGLTNWFSNFLCMEKTA
jgi:hypothetical protein